MFGQLRTLFNVGTIGELTDGQLLERFATDPNESAELAFAAIIERHGALVFRVCRSILRDEHAAEDAFQATFLVLVAQGTLALGGGFTRTVALSSGVSNSLVRTCVNSPAPTHMRRDTPSRPQRDPNSKER